MDSGAGGAQDKTESSLLRAPISSAITKTAICHRDEFDLRALGQERLVRFSLRAGGSSMATRHASMPPIPIVKGTRNFFLRIGFVIVATWPLLLALVLARVLLTSIF
jgi:hypothetical protein